MKRGRTRVVVLGAAGRDFHDFNVVYRDDPSYEVVAFTATQIPGIAGRRYPPVLAGRLYPDGIPIHPEAQLEQICREQHVEQVVFAYSDVSHEHVMHLASRALALGADFVLHGPGRTQLVSRLPVLAVSASRTGCGKSQTARWIATRARARGVRVAVIRHPMPYGDLARERVQRFASLADIAAAGCTNEEREEYEPQVEAGNVVYAGVDYAAVLALAEREADVVVWDGGNNDFPFVRPDLHVVVVDALRPNDVATHHPGEATVRMADVALVSKVDTAADVDVARAIEGVRAINPRCAIARGASPITLSAPDAVRGKRVLVVDDGPTLTHGGMSYGAGYVAALRAGAAEIVDPRPHATGSVARAFQEHPHLARVLPALGYDDAELESLAETIRRVPADVIVSGAPFDLEARVHPDKPVVRARYDFAEVGEPSLGSIVDTFLAEHLRREKRP